MDWSGRTSNGGPRSAGALQTPITFLAGAGEDDSLWEDVLSQLPEGHPAYAPRYSDEGIRERADQALMGRPPSIVVGHSMGGLVALAMSEIAPDMVRGIILVSVGYPVQVHPRIYELLETDLEAAGSYLGAAAAGGRLRELDRGQSAVAWRFARMVERRDPQAVGKELRECETFRLTPGMSQASAPAIAVWGDQDKMLREDGMRGLARSVHASERSLPGAAHQIPWERPEAVIEALQFCDETQEEPT